MNTGKQTFCFYKWHLSRWLHLFSPFKKALHVEDTQKCQLFWFQNLRTMTLHDTHHSLFSVLKWTSLVGWRQPSSSAWQCCGKGLPGTSTSFPSFFAGPCMPTRSHGMAGRSTTPEAQSCSSMCSQTARGREGRLRPLSRDKPPLQEVGRGRRPGSTNPPRFPCVEALLTISENWLTTLNTSDHRGTGTQIKAYNNPSSAVVSISTLSVTCSQPQSENVQQKITGKHNS